MRKDTTYLTVRVPAKTYKKFQQIAKQRDLTVSQEIRHYINLRVEAAKLERRNGDGS